MRDSSPRKERMAMTAMIEGESPDARDESLVAVAEGKLAASGVPVDEGPPDNVETGVVGLAVSGGAVLACDGVETGSGNKDEDKDGAEDGDASVMEDVDSTLEEDGEFGVSVPTGEVAADTTFENEGVGDTAVSDD